MLATLLPYIMVNIN